jgi:heptosyltransferase-2
VYKKILIIKTGHSEVFTEKKHSSIVSLGDVLRTSFILEYFPGAQITWLTSPEAYPLLLGNKLIDELITDISNVNLKEIDMVINLEKDPKLINNISSLNEVYGFYFEKGILSIKLLNNQLIGFDDYLHLVHHHKTSFQVKLARILDKNWEGQRFIIGKLPTKNPKRVVGLNWKTGAKWPEKQLPKTFWTNLSNDFTAQETISFQEGFTDLDEYINWINKCDIIITLDSLGLHIALGLGKTVIGLFGPTNHHHIEMYNSGHKLCYHMDNLDELNQEILSLIQNMD